MKYRKKPVVVDVMLYTGYNYEEIRKFTKDKAMLLHDESEYKDGSVYSYNIGLNTLEGLMYVFTGDYIIKEPFGEFCPCKPDIFEKSYEEVVE